MNKITITKTCPRCKLEKNLDCFYKNKKNKYGRSSWCIACTNEKVREWQKKYPEKCKNSIKNYKLKNKEKLKKVKKEYIKKIRVTQEFKINKYFRKKINEKLKMKDKYLDYYSPTVGCTNRQLKKYIESQFTKEMSWDNYGKIWNVDHIIPIVAFLENIKEERKYINHYLNLQPLLIYNNSKKGKFYKEEDKVALVEKIKNLQNN